MFNCQKRGEKKLYTPFVLVIALFFIGVFAYFVFAVQEIRCLNIPFEEEKNEN